MNTTITRKLWDGRGRWSVGDDGRAVIGPDGGLRCYANNAADLCARLNAAGRAAGDEPRASRA